MNEQGYEQQVERLERKHASAIASIARAAIPTAKREADYEDAILDAAREIVSSALLNDEEWAPVKATDISDIAAGAVEHAWREQRSADGTHHMVEDL